MYGRLHWILLLAVFSVGCGASSTEIEGQVKLDGQPVERGSILLVPTGSTGQGAGGAIENGKYRIGGAQTLAPGSYRVEIRAEKKSGRMVQKPLGQPGELVEEMVEAVAARFNANTELKAEVKSGKNTQNFDVSAK